MMQNEQVGFFFLFFFFSNHDLCKYAWYCVILIWQVPVALVTDMKVATTVFVGNISEKAMDTLVRQMLLVS